MHSTSLIEVKSAQKAHDEDSEDDDILDSGTVKMIICKKKLKKILNYGAIKYLLPHK